MIDIKALAAKAAAEGKDMNVAVAGGGGDYEPPAAGPCRLRFISYIEAGKQEYTMQGKPTTYKDTAILTFEVSGPKHAPTVNDSGEKFPHRITIELPISLNEKANFYKLFRGLNHAGKAKHIAELLGEAYKGTIIHRKYAKRGENKADPSKWTGVAAELYDKSKQVFTIEAPRYELVDPETGPTGEFKVLPVDPPISQLRLFLWDYADKAQWDSIFIDGEYPERKDKDGKVTAPAKSKNVLQNQIKQASNFKGSPIYAVIAAAGGSLDIPEPESGKAPWDGEEQAAAPAETPTGDAATDSLNAVSAPAGQPSLGM